MAQRVEGIIDSVHVSQLREICFYSEHVQVYLLFFTCAEISTSMESTIQVESGTTGYACQQLRIWGLEFDWTLPLDRRRGHSNSLRLIITAALTDITLIH